MSHTQATGAFARHASNITAAAAASLAGRRKVPGDPANPTDPVRAHSYDVDDARASPWQRIGDGSAEYGWAFTEGLRHAARSLVKQHQDEDYAGEHRMQRSYVGVLEALLGFLDYKTGRLTVPYAVIALKALVRPSTAKRAVAALEHWGLVNHVRRSARTGAAAGDAGPHRAQAPNGYYFDCRRRMSPDTWQKFWSRVLFNLKRVGAAGAKRAVLLTHTFNEVARQAPRAAGELGEVLARIKRTHFPDAPAPEPGS